MPVYLVPPVTVVDNGGSFARASAAAFVGSNGLLQSAAANIPRWEYDPVTLACLGALMEYSAATNLALWSEQFDNAVWVKTNGAIMANNATAPDGTVTADTFTASAAGGEIAQTVALSAVCTSSLWIKRRAGTGTVSIRNSAGSAYIPLTLTTAWQRLSNDGGTSVTNAYVDILLAVSGDAVDLWGAQLETGAKASSYIQTVGVTATRAADILTGMGLNYSSIPETDYTPWNPVTAYALGNRVIRTTATTHQIYERVVAGTTATTPESDTVNWVVVSPTNRWKMFDTSNTTASTASGAIRAIFTPGQAISAASLQGLLGATATITVIDPVYGRTYNKSISISGVIPSADWYAYFMAVVQPTTVATVLDVPSFVNASVFVNITGGTVVNCATAIIGYQIPIGITDIYYGAKVGIVDYSGKVTNAYGDTIFTKRAFSKRASFDFDLANAQVDSVSDLLATWRSTPALWIGNSGFGSMQIFGFYKSFDITISYPSVSHCQLDIEGLT